jgi:hypothetical protein
MNINNVSNWHSCTRWFYMHRQYQDYIQLNVHWMTVKHFTTPFVFVYFNVNSFIYILTIGCNRYYILFIDDYTQYISAWVLPIDNTKSGSSIDKKCQFRDNYISDGINFIYCSTNLGKWNCKTFRIVLVAYYTIYVLCLLHSNLDSGIAEWRIQIITEMAPEIVINPQASIQF